MPSYSDVQKAVNAEKRRTWFGWLTGNVIMLIVAAATQHVHVVSVVTQVLLAVVFLLLTFAALRMTNALNERADAARREVLGDDYPG